MNCKAVAARPELQNAPEVVADTSCFSRKMEGVRRTQTGESTLIGATCDYVMKLRGPRCIKQMPQKNASPS